MSTTTTTPDINLATAYAAEQTAHAKTRAQLAKAGADLTAAVAREQKHHQELTDHKVAVADAHKLRDQYQAMAAGLTSDKFTAQIAAAKAQDEVAWLRSLYQQDTGKAAPAYVPPPPPDTSTTPPPTTGGN